jgi:tetratricopeptide (TPR) repeat protein
LLAYWPVWHAGFIWDDDAYVTANPLLTAPDGLRRIWFTLDSPSQYFPLTYTWLRCERGLWGLHPAGYHGMNLLLHTANALLLWRLLQRLALPGAWLAAALFALHPVQVESVAWVSELKNVLMLFFYLLAVRTWVAFIEQPAGRGQWYYLGALGLAALALCAKATACTLPVTLLLILWLKRKPIGWVRLAQTAPFFGLSLVMGLLTMWWERYHQGTQGTLFAMTWLQRVLVASHAFWFYLGKLVWPVNLTFSYPRWTINPADVSSYLWLAAAAAALVGVVYFTRRFQGRGVAAALLFFVVTLSPVMGFIMLYTFRYTYVADHYQYVACIGPLALAAALMEGRRKKAEGRMRNSDASPLIPLPRKGRRKKEEGRSAETDPQMAAIFHLPFSLFPLLSPLFYLLPVVLGVLTWQQCGMYADAETLWRVTLARNPDCEMALVNSGNLLAYQGQTTKAIQNYQRALQLDPNDAEAHCDLGGVLAHQGQFTEAMEHCEQALQLNPDDAQARNNLGFALASQGNWNQAVLDFERAVALNPKYADAQVNLGVALAKLGRWAEAIRHYEQALQVKPDFADAHFNLGVALAHQGKLNEAVPQFQETLNLATAQGNTALVTAARAHLQPYPPTPPQSPTP